ncbi:MAG: hypothetical protein ACLFUH_03355 [Bacteroidales bacterium]
MNSNNVAVKYLCLEDDSPLIAGLTYKNIYKIPSKCKEYNKSCQSKCEGYIEISNHKFCTKGLREDGIIKPLNNIKVYN